MVCSYIGFVFAIMSGVVDEQVLAALFQLTIGIFAASRLPQIYVNFKVPQET